MKQGDGRYWHEIEFSFQVPVIADGNPDPSMFVHKISGNIIREDCEERQDPVKIGSISLVLMDIENGIEAGWSAFQIVDSFDAESADYGQVLFDGDGSINETVLQAFDMPEWISRVLILEAVKIDAQYRGRSVGLLAARHAIELFGYDAFVILKPFPLQFSQHNDPKWVAPEGVTDKDKDFEKARKKLERYWKRLGVRAIGKTGYFGMYGTDDLRTATQLLSVRRKSR
jgi:hypothetical protein